MSGLPHAPRLSIFTKIYSAALLMTLEELKIQTVCFWLSSDSFRTKEQHQFALDFLCSGFPGDRVALFKGSVDICDVRTTARVFGVSIDLSSGQRSGAVPLPPYTSYVAAHCSHSVSLNETLCPSLDLLCCHL